MTAAAISLGVAGTLPEERSSTRPRTDTGWGSVASAHLGGTGFGRAVLGDVHDTGWG
ncbi:hypothetical protein AB0L74_28305 [Streptomyces sp. NPDC052020]|uniref:hypothetical protein n=1 Tax=Streptomyces sp. NPDC052020 TaxID=3155677 RepID=UPI00343E05A7